MKNSAATLSIEAKGLLKQPEWIAAILMTIVAVGLHVFFLFHAGGLWRDEVNLVNLANRHSLSEMAKDSFPVLMPLAVSGWSAIGLGQSDLGMRSLGVLVGIGILAALWIAAWRLRRPPLYALAFFALNPMVISYGDSLRGHGLGTLLLILTIAAMVAFLQNPSWLRAGILTTAAIFSVQALFQNSIFFAAICFAGWAICWQRKNRGAAAKILVAAVIAAFSLLPYWKNFVGLPAASVQLRGNFSFADVADNFKTVTGFPMEQFCYAWEIFALIVVCIGLAPLWRTLSKSNQPGTTPAAEVDLSLFAPVLLVAASLFFLIFLKFADVAVRRWYLLPPIALWAVCFNFSLPSLPRPMRTPLLGFAAGTALISILYAQQQLHQRFTNVDHIAKLVNTQASPDDFVIVAPWFCGVSYQRYHKSSAPWQTLPPLSDHETHRYDLILKAMQGTNVIQPVLEKMTTTLEAGHRVWLVGTMDVSKPGAAMPNDLPPPPSKRFGWSDVPYTLNWSQQVSAFLGNHSQQFERVYMETNHDLIANEDLQLLVAAGWTNRVAK